VIFFQLKYCYKTKSTVQMWQNNFNFFFLKFGDFFPQNWEYCDRIIYLFILIFSRFGEISHPKKSLIMTYDINIQQ